MALHPLSWLTVIIFLSFSFPYFSELKKASQKMFAMLLVISDGLTFPGVGDGTAVVVLSQTWLLIDVGV